MHFPTEGLPSPTLLIVEDEFMIARELRRILANAGYRIIGMVGSVAEAITTITQEHPDIVLLDIFLDGEATGIDLAHWLRKQNTPFVYLSANLTDQLLVEAKQTQPFGFLNKPFREKDVLTTLEVARYRHAHGEEAKLRKQKSLQMAVNNAIITVQDRERLCWAIASQINALVPFRFFKLRTVAAEEGSEYCFMLRQIGPATFERIYFTAFQPGGGQELDELEQQSLLLVNESAGIFSGTELDRLCEQYSMLEYCRDLLELRSLALFPIPLSQKLTTYLILAHTELFTEKDYDWVSLLTPQIALALNNSLAYDQINTHRLLKSTELAIVSAFLHGTTLAEILPEVALSLNALLPFDCMIVHRQASGLADLTLAVQKMGARFKVIPETAWVTELTSQNEHLAAFGSEQPIVAPYRSVLHLPVTTKNHSTVHLSLLSLAAYAFTGKDEEMVRGIGHHFSLALENLLAYDQISSLSEQLKQEKTYLIEEIQTNHNFEEIVGTSAALQAVLKSIDQVAKTDATVLITGETGTGKELIARAIHNLSLRKNKSIIKVNCAALPAQLIESELFGHERGSFTGAIEKRIGKFELASGSTIFLDEIGELPLDLQAKLLRVIQEKEVERLGGKGSIQVNVRIIAATNRNLQQEVAAGRFRSDLYFRLNVFPVCMPPLRERFVDIKPLAFYFLRKISKKIGKSFTGIAQPSLDQMQRYNWPGNIRELEHVLERAAILSQTSTLVLAEPLQSVYAPAADQMPAKPVIAPLQDTMRSAILAALLQSGYRIRGQGGAAELLHIKPTTLEARMKKLNINPRH